MCCILRKCKRVTHHSLHIVFISTIQSFDSLPNLRYMKLIATFAGVLALSAGVLWGPVAAHTATPYEPFETSSYWKKASTNTDDSRSYAMISWLASMLHSDRR